VKNKIISIVTPSYNQEKFIARTLESVLKQEGNFYLDFIIFDAVSKDGSVEIIKKYENLLKENCTVIEKNSLKYFIAKDKNFAFNKCLGISYRWFCEKDGGQSEAINKGFKLAVGDVVAWLNSDDYYLDGVLEIVAQNLHLKNLDILYGKAIACDENQKELWNYPLPDLNLYILMNKKTMIPQPSIFFKRSLFERYCYVRQDLHYCMDYELLLRFLLNNANVKKINQNLSVQTYHDSSKSCSQPEKFLIERSEINREYRNKMGLVKKLQIWKFRFKYKYIPSLMRWIGLSLPCHNSSKN
jgi:glycosyltransferase involved in cell wall biosynthesis